MSSAPLHLDSAAPSKHSDYRTDIDGLRGISVSAVVLFHMGLLPRGYLGVDVFFVISGFLITGIIFREQGSGRFSLRDFFLRRVRRILPLTVTVVTLALGLGYLWMLPDDYENLAQSLIATNLFSNNILQLITTENYWDVVNEYKPLMHTWSLGVEEQFYFVYPWLFVVFGVKRGRGSALLLPVIVLLSVVSLGWYLSPAHQAAKFYLLHYRFWELAIGGIAAILIQQGRLRVNALLSYGATLLLLVVLAAAMASPPSIDMLVVVLSATTILSATAGRNMLLNNPLLVGLGKISFSLYMWHQLVLAFARYIWKADFSTLELAVLGILMLLLSLGSYYGIEQPFRNKTRVSVRFLLTYVVGLVVISSGLAWQVYRHNGVVRDIPELEIARQEYTLNQHSQYNDRIYKLDRDFESADKIRVLVIGNSYGRDWANALLESRFAPKLELSYIRLESPLPKLAPRIAQAQIIFYCQPQIIFGGEDSVSLDHLQIPADKLWIVGVKNFGQNNGVFYNHSGQGYFEQTAPVSALTLAANDTLRKRWGARYLDLLEPVMNPESRVRIFTPDHKFISHDCRHFTRAGARYFAELLEPELARIFRGSDN